MLINSQTFALIYNVGLSFPQKISFNLQNSNNPPHSIKLGNNFENLTTLLKIRFLVLLYYVICVGNFRFEPLPSKIV